MDPSTSALFSVSEPYVRLCFSCGNCHIWMSTQWLQLSCQFVCNMAGNLQTLCRTTLAVFSGLVSCLFHLKNHSVNTKIKCRHQWQELFWKWIEKIDLTNSYVLCYLGFTPVALSWDEAPPQSFGLDRCFGRCFRSSHHILM